MGLSTQCDESDTTIGSFWISVHLCTRATAGVSILSQFPCGRKSSFSGTESRLAISCHVEDVGLSYSCLLLTVPSHACPPNADGNLAKILTTQSIMFLSWTLSFGQSSTMTCSAQTFLMKKPIIGHFFHFRNNHAMTTKQETLNNQ